MQEENKNIEKKHTLFEEEDFQEISDEWRNEWKNMPEFIQEDLEPFQKIIVNFETKDDVDSFSKLLGKKLSYKANSIWYPLKDIIRNDKAYICTNEQGSCNKYPIYIISKGRWERPLTSRALDRMNVNYKIVIEPQEYNEYSSVIDKNKILILPFSNLGQGSIPARNWVWEHSISIGAERHWIIDDNIDGFVRLNRNKKIPVNSGVIFKIAEDFIDRYKNIALAGFHYRFFAAQRSILPPYYLNTRIYSCILIKNDIQHRWRGRYNEDTDLSLRVLKDGYCTILFNAFLSNKIGTMLMKGGNTDELYKDDGRLKMAKSLEEQHPDVVRVTWKWNRWQHHVDYRKFQNNKLILKDGIKISDKINNFDMTLINIEDWKKEI